MILDESEEEFFRKSNRSDIDNAREKELYIAWKIRHEAIKANYEKMKDKEDLESGKITKRLVF